MKKGVLVFFVSFGILFLISGVVQAQAPLVSCGQPDQSRCELGDIFKLVLNVYNFLLYYIAIPLAGLAIVIGGVILLASAGSPGLASLARNILWGAVCGILLIWCAWLIVHTVLMMIGYTGPI